MRSMANKLFIFLASVGVVVFSLASAPFAMGQGTTPVATQVVQSDAAAKLAECKALQDEKLRQKCLNVNLGIGTDETSCKDAKKTLKDERKAAEKEFKDTQKEILESIDETKNDITTAKSEIDKANTEKTDTQRTAHETQKKDLAELTKTLSEEEKKLKEDYDAATSAIIDLGEQIEQVKLDLNIQKINAIRQAEQQCYDFAMQALQAYRNDRNEAIRRNQLASENINTLFSSSGATRKDKDKRFAEKYYVQCIQGTPHKNLVETIETSYLNNLQKALLDLNRQIRSESAKQDRANRELTDAIRKQGNEQQRQAIEDAFKNAFEKAEAEYQGVLKTNTEKIETLTEKINNLERQLADAEIEKYNRLIEIAQGVMESCGEDEKGKSSPDYKNAEAIIKESKEKLRKVKTLKTLKPGSGFQVPGIQSDSGRSYYTSPSGRSSRGGK